MPTLNPVMDTRLWNNNEATWAAARDDSTCDSNIPTNPTRQSQAVRIGTSAGPSNFDVNRTFFCFDTSDITVKPASATFKLYGYLQNSADVIVVGVQQAATGNASTVFATSDFDLIQGFVSGSTMSGNVRTYSAEISTWDTSAYNEITFTDDALEDMATYDDFKFAIIEYDHDYLNVSPTGSSNINVGFYFRNGAFPPELEYTEGVISGAKIPSQKPLTWAETLKDTTAVDFLLEITYAGRAYRYASRDVHIEMQDGTFTYWEGGLEVDWTSAIDLFNESVDFVSIPFELIFPDDVAELVSKGHDLFQAVGELSMWVEGRKYVERLRLLTGELIDPEYGAKNEPVAFSLQQQGFEDTALAPSATEVYTKDNLGAGNIFNDDLLGSYYPIVIGHPGSEDVNTSPATNQSAGSPAYYLDSGGVATHIIAGHHVEATKVTLRNVTANTSISADVTNGVDLTGQPIAYCAPTGAFTIALNDELRVTWNDGGFPFAVTGGLKNTEGPGALRGAGDVILYFLGRSTITWDRPKWNSIRDYLNQNFKIDAYIDEAVSPYEWLRDNIFPILPLSIVYGVDGLKPILWRYDATPHDAVENLISGAACSRNGSVLYEKQDLANEIRLQYALEASSSGTYTRTLTITGEERPTTSGVFSNTYSRASYNRFGSKQLEIATDVVYTESTAGSILNWMIRAKALPYRVIEYSLEIRYAHLEPGDIVTITDSELFLTNQLALIRGITWAQNRITATLALIENPPLESRS